MRRWREWPWPLITALALALVASGLAVAGIYTLAGLGWALLASAVPIFLLSVVIMRELPTDA